MVQFHLSFQQVSDFVPNLGETKIVCPRDDAQIEIGNRSTNYLYDRCILISYRFITSP